MLVIPAINSIKEREAIEQITLASKFSRWIHLDIVDGKYSPATTWGTPADLEKIFKIREDIKVEVHLMVENPELVLEDWLSAGAERIVIHEDAIRDFSLAINTAKKYSKEIMLSINPFNDDFSDNARLFTAFQILTVNPGFAGQEFNESSLMKIRFLRENVPNAKIEVDGGINPVTSRMVKSAGADIVTSASYIFKNPDPRDAYEKLSSE